MASWQNLLKEWGLEDLTGIFEENGIDDDSFWLLESEEIKELIPKMGPRLKFVKKFSAQKLASMSPSSLLGLNEQKMEETSFDTSCTTLASETDSTSDMHSSKCSLADTIVIEGSSFSSLSSPDNSTSSITSHDQPVSSQASTSFDVISILKQASGGTRLVEKIQAECMLSKRNKREMVDVLAHRLISVHGHLPPSFVKKEMAHGIIKAFPFLKDPDGITGYEAFYCQGSAKLGPARGALEDRVSYLRRLAYQEERAQGRKSPPRKRKRKNEGEEAQSLPASTGEQKPSALQTDDQNGKASLEPSNTKGKCDGEILKIKEKFDENFSSKASKMATRWPALSQQILRFYQRTKDEDCWSGLKKEHEQQNAAFFLLPELFPGRRKGGGRVAQAESGSSFIDMQCESTNLGFYLQSMRGADRLQPYVLCLGGTKLEPQQVFAVIEGKQVPTGTLADAVDLCFKACYAYNLEYQSHCYGTWEFIQSIVYEMPGQVKCPVVREFRAFQKTLNDK